MHCRPSKLLIVDDSRIVRDRLIAFAAEMRGVCLVGAAATGAEAIRLFEAEQPDAVVLDIGLPDVDGLVVLRQLREQSASATVLIYSGHFFPEMIERCERLGADGVFDKSGAVGPLLAALQALGSAPAPVAERADLPRIF